MANCKKISLNYNPGVEYHAPYGYAGVYEQSVKLYVPDIKVGDLVRWAVPAAKGKNTGIPMKSEVYRNGSLVEYSEYAPGDLSTNELRYEDVALVLELKEISTCEWKFGIARATLHARVHTTHGIGWVPVKYLTRINER